MSKYLFYGHEFQWRGDLGKFAPTLNCPDGIIRNIEICGVGEERTALIEAIEHWLRDVSPDLNVLYMSKGIPWRLTHSKA